MLSSSDSQTSVVPLQTSKARLMNDLIAGSVGGFVGTAINTP